MKQKIFFLITIFIFLLVPGTLAQYISGDIYINELGESNFYVETDVDPNIQGLNFDSLNSELTGKTEMLTRMENGIWTFSLDLDTYETIFLEIHLPKSLKLVKSIEGVDSILDVDKKTITLIDNNKKLEFEVSYKIKENSNYMTFIWFSIALILAILITYYITKKKRKNKMDYILPIINDVEKKIVETLMKKNYRQKELRKKLEIPKASFSRYILNLEKKKLILREGEGRNKIIKLK